MSTVYMVWEDGSDMRGIFAEEAEAIEHAKKCHESYVSFKQHAYERQGGRIEDITPEWLGRFTVEEYPLPFREEDNVVMEIWPEDSREADERRIPPAGAAF